MRKQDIWEIEYLRCSTKNSYKKYINKYKNIPENPFVQEAINKVKSNESHPLSDNSTKVKPLSIVIPLVSVLFIGGSYLLYNNRYSLFYKSNDGSGNSFIKITPTLPTINPKPITEPSPSPSPNTAPYPQPYTEPSQYVNPSPYHTPTPKPEANPYEEMYRSQYAEMENQAQRDYNSLTNMGFRYRDNGSPDGYTGRTDPYIASQIATFKQLQHRMRDLRFEASKQGVNISQSQWETAIINM